MCGVENQGPVRRWAVLPGVDKLGCASFCGLVLEHLHTDLVLVFGQKCVHFGGEQIVRNQVR